VNTNSRLEVWVGLVVGLALTSCGGRSVLDDERPYGEDGVAGLGGREILPLTTVPVDVGVTPGPTAGVGPTATTNFTGVSPTQTTTPTAPSTATGTGVTPTVNPTATAVNPTTTAVPTTTGMVPTSVPTTATSVPTTGTTAMPTSGEPSSLPPLVPFPPEGFGPNVPPELQGIDWQDPWQCSPRVYNSVSYCNIEFSCDANDYSAANCNLNGGTWYCDCKSNSDYGYVQLAESAILEGEACRVAGALCESDWPVEETQDCYETNEQGQDYCSYSSNCSYEISSGANVSASKSSQDYSYCNRQVINGDEYVSCGCPYQAEFSVAWDPETTCVAAYNVCSAGIDEGSAGEIECTWNSSSSDLSFCQETERCTQAATANGIPVGLVTVQQTICYIDGEDNWQCYCDYNGSDVRYYTAESAPDACDMARVDCKASIEPLL
jgi:hypothetical protein